MKSISIASIASVLSVVGALALGESVYAAPGLTLSPGSESGVVLEPGSQINGSFEVYNSGDVLLDVHTEVTPMCVNTAYLSIFEGCNVASSTTLHKWITAEAEADFLKPGENTVVNWTINVPTSIPGGSQHAGIVVYYEVGGENSMKMQYKLGYKILAINPVGAREDASLVSAKVDRLQFKRPLSAQMTAKNDGNVDFFAKTKMTVTTLGGKEVYLSGDLNNVVMPGTTRGLSVSWDGAPHLGLFKVKYDVCLENIDGSLIEIKTIEKIVLIIPLFMFVIILSVVAILFVLLVLRIRKCSQLKNARRY